MTVIHELKIFRPYFQAIIEGRKTFEIRDNRDRGFNAGDVVTLNEIYPKDNLLLNGKCTGRQIKAEIGYVTNYEQKDEYVVFSLLRVELVK